MRAEWLRALLRIELKLGHQASAAVESVIAEVATDLFFHPRYDKFLDRYGWQRQFNRHWRPETL
jgi:hypothetical protein